MTLSSSPRLRVLLAMHLKGLTTVEAASELAALDVALTQDELSLAVDADLAVARTGHVVGYSLSPEGRALLRRLVRRELDEAGVRDAVTAAYDDFLAINGDLLDVCTAWQLRAGADGETAANDHTDADYDCAVIARLSAVHDRMRDVLDRLAGTLARFERYRRGLDNALDRLGAGDHDYFTRPMFPSYHSIWFELHEDLLVTLDIDRRNERSPRS